MQCGPGTGNRLTSFLPMIDSPPLLVVHSLVNGRLLLSAVGTLMYTPTGSLNSAASTWWLSVSSGMAHTRPCTSTTCISLLLWLLLWSGYVYPLVHYAGYCIAFYLA